MNQIILDKNIYQVLLAIFLTYLFSVPGSVLGQDGQDQALLVQGVCSDEPADCSGATAKILRKESARPITIQIDGSKKDEYHYHSHYAERLDVDGVKRLLLSLPEVQREIADWRQKL